MQMLALSTTHIRLSESYCFYPLLTLIFGMSTFCSNYSSTSLWQSVNIFPENFNTNVIPCLLKLKPKAFLWMYNRSVKFIFQLAPNLVDGVEVQTLRGPVHYFQCSSRFLLLQVVPALVRRMFRVIFLSENKSRPNKTTQDGTPCLTRMLWYTFLSMIPWIFTKSPVPEAEMAPHTIILPPPCLTVGKRHSFLYLAPLPPSNIHSSLVGKPFKLGLISPQHLIPIFFCPFLVFFCKFQAFHSILLFQ